MDNSKRIGLLMRFWLILMWVFVFVDFMTNDQFLVEWAVCFGSWVGTTIAFIIVRGD